MTSLIAPICLGCKNYIKPKQCAAFDNYQIPQEIWESKFDHRKPFDGDNGIQFDPIRVIDLEYARGVFGD